MNIIADFIETHKQWIYEENFKPRPRYKTVVLGAFGLDYILKHRHNIPGLSKAPRDFNLVISTDRNPDEVFDLWKNLARKYAKLHGLRVQTRARSSIKFGTIKILIDGREIRSDTIDYDMSEKAGVILQKEEYYLADLIKEGKMSRACNSGINATHSRWKYAKYAKYEKGAHLQWTHIRRSRRQTRR